MPRIQSDAHRDERGAHCEARDRRGHQRRGVHLPHEAGDLEADQEEHDTVQEEHEHLPHGATGEANVGTHDARGPPAEIETGGDRGEDAGEAYQLRRKIGGVRGQE